MLLTCCTKRVIIHPRWQHRRDRPGRDRSIGRSTEPYYPTHHAKIKLDEWITNHTIPRLQKSVEFNQIWSMNALPQIKIAYSTLHIPRDQIYAGSKISTVIRLQQFLHYRLLRKRVI